MPINEVKTSEVNVIIKLFYCIFIKCFNDTEKYKLQKKFYILCKYCAEQIHKMHIFTFI